MAVAPPISVKPVEQSVVLLCHWYDNTPSPVAATDSVKAAGSPPEQIVWEAATVPPVTILTVTVIQLLLAVHGTPLSVLVVTLR